MSKAKELIKFTEQEAPQSIGMKGQLHFEKDIGLIFSSENEQGETVVIAIPISKEDLLSVVNQAHESLCENVTIKR
jgi:hypothetical protein